MASGVIAAGISHSYRLLGNGMSSSSIVGTHVDGVHVVEASTCRVNLDHLVTHVGVRWLGPWESVCACVCLLVDPAVGGQGLGPLAGNDLQNPNAHKAVWRRTK